MKELGQDATMRFSPVNGLKAPDWTLYPSHAAQFRAYHGPVAWLYNPWTGRPRDPRDIGTDPTGILIAVRDELEPKLREVWLIQDSHGNLCSTFLSLTKPDKINTTEGLDERQKISLIRFVEAGH